MIAGVLTTRRCFVALVLCAAAMSRIPSSQITRLAGLSRSVLETAAMPLGHPLHRLSVMVRELITPGEEVPWTQLTDDPEELKERLEWAYQRIEQLQSQLESEREAITWFEQIRDFVDFQRMDTEVAAVVSLQLDPTNPAIVINKGRRDGVVAGLMVVGTGAEMVGFVEEAGELSSRVRLLISPGTMLRCRLVPPDHSREGVSVRLHADKQAAYLTADVDSTLDVGLGDMAVLDDASAGITGNGFVTGRVYEIIDPHPDPTRAMFYKKVVVKPVTPADRMQQVVVLVPRLESISNKLPESKLEESPSEDDNTVPATQPVEEETP